MEANDIVIKVDYRYLLMILVPLVTLILFPIQNELTWVILVIALSGLFTFVYQRADEDTLTNKKYAKQLIITLICAGFLIRLYEINSLSLWHDEAVTANIVKSFIENGIPTYPSGKLYTRELFNQVLLSVSSKIFGHSDWALRIPSAIAGTLTIGVTYLTGREFFNREVGLISAFFIAFSTWQITWSNQVRMYGLLQLLFLSTILMIYYNYHIDADYQHIATLLVLMVLAIFTHLIGYLLPFVLISYSFLVFIQSNKSIRSLIYVTLPIIFVFISINLFHQNIIELIFSWLEFTSNTNLYVEWLVNNYNVMLGLGILGGFIGLKENMKASYLSAVSILPIFVVFFWFWETPGSRYLFVTFPFFAIFSALFLSKFSHLIHRANSKNTLSRSTILIFLVVLTFSFGNFASGNYEPGLRAPQADFRSAYTYIGERIQNNDTVISSWTAPTVHYLREPDYALIPESSVPMSIYQGKDYYSGAPIIYNASQLSNIVNESERGWLVLDDRAYNSQDKSRKKIIKELDKVQNSSTFREITVWKWDRESNK